MSDRQRHRGIYGEATRERDERVVAAVLSGMTYVEISDRFKISTSRVAKIIAKAREAGVAVPDRRGRNGRSEPPPPAPPSPSRSRAWTADELARLQRYRAAGIGLTSIAAHLRRPYRDIAAYLEGTKQ